MILQVLVSSPKINKTQKTANQVQPGSPCLEKNGKKHHESWKLVAVPLKINEIPHIYHHHRTPKCYMGTGIFTYMNGLKSMSKLVGKFSSPIWHNRASHRKKIHGFHVFLRAKLASCEPLSTTTRPSCAARLTCRPQGTEEKDVSWFHEFSNGRTHWTDP